MSFITKFCIFQTMILVPFILGALIQNKLESGTESTKKLIRVNLICIEPLIVLWSVWGLTLKVSLILLPISGLALALIGMIAGWLMNRVLGLRGKTKATFLISSSLANHGFTMGAFLCYLFLGERGLGLAFIFLAYFIVYLFLVIFPYSGLVSKGQGYSLKFLKEYFVNLQNMPLWAVIAGIVLQVIGIGRPQIYFPIDIFILIAVAIYYFTLGVNFNMIDIVANKKENVAMGIIKFMIVPAIAFSILPLINIDESMRIVIRIQSYMPVAIYSVVASVLFDLDSRLASGLFVVNMILFLVIVLPVIFLWKNRLLGVVM
ncbi:MAG: hypothetical protein JW920_09375 [Deltaproteobacteria bacterium]|nr:hypothetical protein [Deltaproteobacteria bacterium]